MATRLHFQDLFAVRHLSCAMTSQHLGKTFFGPFDVTTQVFYKTPLSFAIVNLKPLLPGHVLVSSRRIVQRLGHLTPEEVTDLFTAVQKVQSMMANIYFIKEEGVKCQGTEFTNGSFNVAIQDGPEAGQSVPHLHCHIIPRLRGDMGEDEIYDRMASESGNVGGHLWDLARRPKTCEHFPKVADSERQARSLDEMAKEAEFYRQQMALLPS